MGERSVDPRAVDLPALCREGGRLEGQLALAQMHRLAAGLLERPADAAAHWTASASRVPVAGGEPELWLHLMAQAGVVLQCQRCLQPTTVALDVDRRLRWVRGEAEAARLDELSEEDVLELPPRLDMTALVEDELILALPLVPRHEVCPQPLLPPGDDAPAQEPNPFAALAALRRRPPPG